MSTVSYISARSVKPLGLFLKLVSLPNSVRKLMARSCEVEDPNQTVIDEVRIDSMIAV